MQSYSAVSMYARPMTSVVHVIDQDRQGDADTLSVNFLEMLRQSNEDLPIPSREWSVHSPEVRSVFQDIKSKLNDLDAIYKNHSDAEVLPTESDIKHKEEMHKSVDYFKLKITENFEQFVKYEKECEKLSEFLKRLATLLEYFESPTLDDDTPFVDCSKTISKSIENLLLEDRQKLEKISQLRNFYYAQYAYYRNECKLITEVQSDLVCTLCMNSEIQIALTPCGHAFCSMCAARCPVVCPNCREPVSKRLKLYF